MTVYTKKPAAQGVEEQAAEPRVAGSNPSTDKHHHCPPPPGILG